MKAIRTGPHVVDGKYLDVKQALPHNMTQDPEATCSPKKVYIGGLPHTVDTTGLAIFFQQFGSIECAMVMRDSEGNHRGFGYVTYAKEECARACVHIRYHFINNTWVEAKKSQPKNTIENEKAKNGRNGSPKQGQGGNGMPGILGAAPVVGM